MKTSQNEIPDSGGSHFNLQRSIVNYYLSQTEPVDIAYEADDEWGSSWSDHIQGSFTDEEYFLSDGKSNSSSKSGQIDEGWNVVDPPDSSGSADLDNNDSWPQLDNTSEEWVDQTADAWGDLEEPQRTIDWDFETKGMHSPINPFTPKFQKRHANSMDAEPEPREPQTTEEAILIDTLEKLDEFLPLLSQLKDGVELALDCEGTPEIVENGVIIPGGGFGRNGNLSFLSMTIISMNKTYLFDVWTLKLETFERKNEDGVSLKQVLESENIIQLWWDVRSDWDTLYHVFDIQIGKVRDLQLMEFLSRTGSQNTNIYGLARTMREEGKAFMGREELEEWLYAKQSGSNYFKEHDWKPLVERPINETARSYIAGDTNCLFQLHNRLYTRMQRWSSLMQGKTVGGLMPLLGKESTSLATMEDLMEFIDEESVRRARDATSPGFDAKSWVGKTIPPAAFIQIAGLWVGNSSRISKRREEDLAAGLII